MKVGLTPVTHTRLRMTLIALLVFTFTDLLLLLALVVAHADAPASVQPGSLAPPFLFLVAASVASLLVGITYALVIRPGYRWPIVFILLVTGGTLLAHFYIIGTPATIDCYNTAKRAYGCVMDEVYYVPAAQTLLVGTKCAPYADDCNLEHPFLSKAFVAAGIELFGLDVFGWRFFQVLLGTMSIPLLFALCLAVSSNKRLAYYATLFFAFDTLFFVHSSVAVIDVHAIFFALLAFVAYFGRLRFWRVGPYVLSGIFLGLSGLSKETSIFFALFLVSYHYIFTGGSLRERTTAVLKITIALVLVFSLGMQLYDSLFTTSAIHTFLDHLKFMLSYGSSLTGRGWTDSELGTPITPFDWMLYYSPIGYLITRVTIHANSASTTYVSIGYYGITNKLETWLTFLWAPYVFYLLAKRSSPERALQDFSLAVVALVWYLWTYLPYILLYAVGRVTYPYYMIQAVPAMAMGCAYVVSRDWFPRIMAWIFIAATFAWFLLYFPNKDFLPIWLRAMLGR